MATSGQVQGNGLNIGGNGGQFIFVNWQLAGQNVAGNYSTINWQAYFHFNRADAQLDNGYVDGGGGRRWTNGGRIYNFTGNYTTKDIGLASGSFNVGHDGAGNASFGIGASISVFQTGTSSGSQSWSLPNIPRYANITQLYTDNVTDESIRLNWAADSNCNYVSWWSSQIDGGAHHDIPVSGSGLFQITRSGLESNKQYDFKVAVRRADSNLWTESGTIYATTLPQGNFLMLL